MSRKRASKKKWDVTFVAYRGEEVEVDTEEEAREIAEDMKEPNEKVGVIQPWEEMPHVD